jgi:protein gp37
MGATTGIAWTNHTFNPWWGCTKVSPGCDHCYAETFDKRVHGVGKGHWGKEAPRREFGEKHWNEPLKWNREAKKAGKPALVFCASMADWCDVDAPPGAVERLHGLWKATPWLRWQMLTKRPARITANLPADWGSGYHNVWLGTTVEDQLRAESRVPVLLGVPAVVRFLSIEPLLESVSLVLHDDEVSARWNTLTMGIHWVIVGGESGHGARPFHVEWARKLKAQCEQAGVAFFMKQMGSRPRAAVDATAEDVAGFRAVGGGPEDEPIHIHLMDSKGGLPVEWPEDLRVQQFPEVG